MKFVYVIMIHDNLDGDELIHAVMSSEEEAKKYVYEIELDDETVSYSIIKCAVFNKHEELLN